MNKYDSSQKKSRQEQKASDFIEDENQYENSRQEEEANEMEEDMDGE